ncbi:monooxygenase [Halomonas sp. TBZ9]|uniref:Monooxygenase n=1 Tax=Vreelandella azerica TaxID=2732867 RepID=A0A7Y3XA78_9GAMM|nr:monooxygenase [Halomonas azerica]NOG32472.1 monooxygenase [Halomonas azerica]
MSVILQVHFPFNGPFGEEMTNAMTTLAESINHEPGLIWKIWTEDADQQLAGGIYLFDTRINAEAYCEMHTARLGAMGVTGIKAVILDANTALSTINKGPTDPSYEQESAPEFKAQNLL